jgi:tryptophan synthase alpha chain
LSRIRSAIESRLRAGARAFVPFLTAGYPDAQTTRECALALAALGATALELGVPFSDPIADGPVLERAATVALARGMTPAGVLDVASKIHERAPELPLIIMSYINPIMQCRGSRGESFLEAAEAAGVDGILLTDVPPEEPHEIWSQVEQSGLDAIVLVSPTTKASRLPLLARRAGGFVYCVSRLGVTGRGSSTDRRLAELVQAARAATGLPALIGFGVGSGADARRVAPLADGVVVGSALIERLSAADPVGEVSALGREIVAALAAPALPS